MITSLYSAAKSIVDSMDESDPMYDEIKKIIDVAVDDGLGNDAGADTGDLWN